MKQEQHKSDGTLIMQRWNEQYENGTYSKEPPIPFTRKILDKLAKNPRIMHGCGIYIGCGNGRNYIPISKSVQNLVGLDISTTAIAKLSENVPQDMLVCKDFSEFVPKESYDYLIAIQVFQHGTENMIKSYFDKVRNILNLGGLFFLRVNSVSTQIYHNHSIIEKNEHGGFTIQYLEGPKKGLYVHFFTKQEIIELVGNSFVMLELEENTTARTAPKTGSWSQLEIIFQKT